MDKRRLEEKISDGYIQIRGILEVVGRPKKHVQDSLKNHLKKIKEVKEFEILNEHIETAEKQEDLFSAFAEVEILVKNMDSLLSFCFDFMPSSIEIIAPETLILKNHTLIGFLNDLQIRMHAMNTGILQAKESSLNYIKNTAVLLRNFIVVLLSSRPMTLDEMYPLMGVSTKNIEQVLSVLMKEGKVKKEGDLYKVIPKK
ncbi:MAG: hypothetical protein AABW92_01900 [Nanoarchaeota archaeon]